MMMTNIWCAICVFSLFSAMLTGQGSALGAAVAAGAQAGFRLGISIGGSLALWTGGGKLMEAGGVTDGLTRFLSPVLVRLFPTAAGDPATARAVSGNICANFLGLGNAATPMGIRAVRGMIREAGTATDEMCRLIVLNTASIQLIPATVGAVRGSLGAARPIDILPAVWVSSLCSAGLGVTAAWLLGKVWRDD